MNEIESLPESLQIQRLIDGEISIAEIRRLSQAAEQSPELWRVIGVTLLEDRCWQHQIGTTFENLSLADLSLAEEANRETDRFPGNQTVSNCISNPPLRTLPAGFVSPSMASIDHKTPASATTSVEPEFQHLPHLTAVKTAGPGFTKRDDSRDLSSGKMRWLLLAASLMMAVWLGYALGQYDPPSGQLAEQERWQDNGARWHEDSAQLRSDFAGLGGKPAGGDRNGSAMNNPPVGIRPAMLQPERHYDLPPNSQSTLRGSVPLYSVDSVAQLQLLEQADDQRLLFSPEQIERLSKQGIVVRQKMDLIEGNLEDGRIFVVPIRTLQFSAGQ